MYFHVLVKLMIFNIFLMCLGFKKQQLNVIAMIMLNYMFCFTAVINSFPEWCHHNPSYWQQD